MRGKDRETAPRAMQREATRTALLEAAYALSRRDGADPLDPAAVAAEAGVSRPLFYRYFHEPAEFVEALLTSLHASPARYPLEPAGSSAAPPSARPPTPATSSDRVTTAERLTGFFVSLAAPLDRQPDLARVLIPRSHLPGPVASARTKRREGAIDRIEALLPESLSERRHRAAFLMDAFLGLQLAWSKRQGPADEGLADRVRRDLRWAVAGVLCDLNDSGVATRSTERDVSDGDARDDRRLGRSTTEPND